MKKTKLKKSLPKLKLSKTQLSILLVTLMFAILFVNAYPGSYSASSPLTCGINCSGIYELFGHSPEYCDASPIECFNTIDECKDGSFDGVGSEYEWVENLTITDLNDTSFNGEDTIEIKGDFDCDWDGDSVAFAYNNGSGWRNIFYDICDTAQINSFYYNLTLDEIKGNHSVRAIIVYGSYTDMVCGYDHDTEFSDTDDISFFVNSFFESTPPSVTNLTPIAGESFEYVTPRTIKIKSLISDDTGIENVYANITSNELNQTLIMSNIGGNYWEAEFTDTNITGRYDVLIYAEDISGNINNSETTHFFIIKTKNITLISPINEYIYPNYSLTLEYSFDTNSQVESTGYIINNEFIFELFEPVSIKNDVSNVTLFFNNSNINISQSFLLSENFNLTRALLKIKSKGVPSQFTLELKNDMNNSPNATIAYANFTNAPVDSSFEWIEFDFEQKIPLAKDNTYWLTINKSDDQNNYFILEANEGVYPFGNLSENNSVNASSDLLFSIFEDNHYKINLNFTNETKNLSAFADLLNGEVGLTIESPTITFSVDKSGPSFSDISYMPITSELLDPYTQINFSLNITDTYNVSDAIFQMIKEDETEWQNYSMSFTGSEYLSNFMPLTEGVYVFRIFASDSLGNKNFSSNDSLSVFNEKRYSINSSELKTEKGAYLDLNASFGGFSIKNTGDVNLTFNIKKNESTVPQVYFNDEKEINITLMPNEESFINVTITSLAVESTSKIQLLIIPDNETNLSISALNSTIVSFVSGPHFVPNIKTYSSQIIQGTERVIFAAEVTNVGNETGQNVVLEWLLPSGWTSKGNLTKNLSTLSIGEKQLFQISLAIPSDATLGDFEVTFLVKNNLTNSTDARTITITPPPNQAVSSGGESRSGKTQVITNTINTIIKIKNPELEITLPETIELVRGENTTFLAVLTNKDDSNITNISLSIEGYNPAYTIITPKNIENLEKNSSTKINITLISPFYLNSGKYPLKLTANFNQNGKTWNYNNNTELIILETDKNEILLCTINAKEKISQYSEKGFNINNLNLLLLDAEKSISDKDYDLVKELCDEIINTLTLANESKEYLNFLDANKEDVSESAAFKDSLLLAKNAFDQGDFALANKLSKDARIVYGLEKNSPNQKIKNAKNMIYHNIYWILLMVILIGTISFLTYTKVSINYNLKKLENLKKSESSIYELITKVQEERFRNKMISKKVYEKHMDSYRMKLAKIQDEKNSIRLKIMSSKGLSKVENLKSQLELITHFKKEIQTDFYIKKVIDKKSYATMSMEYDVIISELNEKLNLEKKNPEK